MRGQFIILRGDDQRALACEKIRDAPDDSTVNIVGPGRTLPQNALFWSKLSDVSRQVQHAGRTHSPELWKALFLSALGEEMKTMEGLSGEQIPLGYRSSRLSKAKMGELLDFIDAWGTQNGVIFHARDV